MADDKTITMEKHIRYTMNFDRYILEYFFTQPINYTNKIIHDKVDDRSGIYLVDKNNKKTLLIENNKGNKERYNIPFKWIDENRFIYRIYVSGSSGFYMDYAIFDIKQNKTVCYYKTYSSNSFITDDKLYIVEPAATYYGIESTVKLRDLSKFYYTVIDLKTYEIKEHAIDISKYVTENSSGLGKISPDGSKIVVMRYGESQGEYDISVLSAKSGELLNQFKIFVADSQFLIYFIDENQLALDTKPPFIGTEPKEHEGFYIIDL